MLKIKFQDLYFSNRAWFLWPIWRVNFWVVYCWEFFSGFTWTNQLKMLFVQQTTIIENKLRRVSEGIEKALSSHRASSQLSFGTRAFHLLIVSQYSADIAFDWKALNGLMGFGINCSDREC